LQERKKTLFAKYDYLLGEVKLRYDEKDDEIKIVVEARILPNKN
jgi:hypothetical protein